MSFHTLFPLSYFWKGEVDNVNLLLDHCNNIENLTKVEKKDQPWKDRCLIETYNITDESILYKSLTNPLQKFADDLQKNTSASNTVITIDYCWLNVYHKNYYQETHSHLTEGYNNDSRWSAVIFLNNGKGYSTFSFVNPVPSLRKNNLVKSSWILDPKPGDVVIFPCETIHQVSPHKSSEKRMTIAFNFTLESE